MYPERGWVPRSRFLAFLAATPVANGPELLVDFLEMNAAAWAFAASCGAFFCALCWIVLPHAPMLFFARRQFARTHRAFGAALLVWLVYGFADAVWLEATGGPALVGTRVAYDVTLGLLGIGTTVSAARDFGSHRYAKQYNQRAGAESGVLAPEATVAQAEMIEHAFYQGLNLLQVLFLHACAVLAPASSVGGLGAGGSARRWLPIALSMVTALPWHWRGSFPVHSFSANYAGRGRSKTGGGAGAGAGTALTRALYRIKKWQYVFYKHFLLHGLNASVALDLAFNASSAPPLIYAAAFRSYWVALNTSYVVRIYMCAPLIPSLVFPATCPERVCIVLLVLGTHTCAAHRCTHPLTAALFRVTPLCDHRWNFSCRHW